MMNLQDQFADQEFANKYALVDGVAMHAENGERFQIPPDVMKRHICEGIFVELRIDSPRFSVHEDDAANCTCPSCNGQASKPILSHDHPASLLPLPPQSAPSRGWGEDFWVKVTKRQGDYFKGVIDNPLVEARLHELQLGDSIIFHSNHILAIHSIHRQDMVLGMEESDLRELVDWLGRQQKEE